jgi:hypothetical protein
MRLLTPILLAGVLLVGPAAGQASAVTIADLINLKANGLSDQILIALIESDGSVFRLTADDVIDLRKRGLSETVLIAMLLTATKADRDRAAAPDSPFADGRQGVIRQDRTLQTSQPTTVNVHQTVTQSVQQYPQETETVYVPVPVAVPVAVLPPRPRAEPVYWGYGGQRRPDSWNDPPDRKPDPKPDPKSDSKPDPKTESKSSPSTVKADEGKPSPAGKVVK